ncbi:palmitoyltransferase ZDHHC1 isoform X3 [Phyllopteryx taeniolatus]|uniref:palmitoyltransferase ZDHHC1 isoform X3 n=1 Tax=Phyllopteryx taeniolatus TaxID=161469 RepID=UPI002AD44EFA|nr:palmitoyltransferase ZDHHC1 isoform X3 [Phyllopteryx taeniolatus]
MHEDERRAVRRGAAVLSDQRLELASSSLADAGLAPLRLLRRRWPGSLCAAAARALDARRVYRILESVCARVRPPMVREASRCACQCTGVILACHLCAHVTAVSVDPADRNVRAKSLRGPLPVFDRSERAHVIENCHCYLCQVDVGPKSKHCSACNKCVANFDHHCRWLNNCVGSRNYNLFLYSVASAVLGACVLLVVSSYVLIEFFLEPDNLRADQHFWALNETASRFPFVPAGPLRAPTAAIPALAAVTVAMALLACVLLCHLLAFHFYLMWNRLSTYEYIVRQRHRQDGRRTSTSEDLRPAADPSVRSKDGDNSETLGYTNSPLDGGTAQRSKGNGSVRGVASPLLELEAPPTISTEHSTVQHTYTKKTTKKKRIPLPGAIGAEGWAPPPAPSSSERVGASPLGRPPPKRPGLPPAPSPPVRAAAPPAEYHSDSAESLEEVPVALDKLGSSSPPPPLPLETHGKYAARLGPPAIFVSGGEVAAAATSCPSPAVAWW